MRLGRLRDWTNLGFALLVFALVLSFFLATGPRGIAWLDGASYQRRVVLLDVGEGPWEEPLFVLLAQPFQLVPWESAERRVALAAAVFAAGACLFVYLLVKSLLSMAPQFIARRVGLIGALVLAVSHVFWLRATAPGPETLDALLLAAILFGLVRYSEHGLVGYFYGAMFLLGVSFSNNLLMVFLLPVFAVYARIVKPPLVREIGRVRARGLVVLLIGASIAVALTAWGWSLAGFKVAPDKLSWITSFRDHLRLDPGAATHFGASLAYSFIPAAALFALRGLLQLSRHHRAFFWLVFFIFLVNSALAVTLRLDRPMNAYVASWVIVAIAAGYGWWKTLADGGWRDFLIALALTVAPVPIYRVAPAVVEKLNVEVPVLRFAQPAFEAPIDPLAFFLNPARDVTEDARGFAQTALEAVPSGARLAPASPGGELVLAPLVYLHDVENQNAGVSFLEKSVDQALLSRLAAETEHPLFLSGLHPPRPEVEQLLDGFVFVPKGFVFQVVAKDRVPGRSFVDQDEAAPLPGDWCGVERPQGYLVSFLVRESTEGTLSAIAILNEGGARPLQGAFSRLSLVSGALSATITYRSYNVHLEGTQVGNRLEGSWYVYQAPELKGSFIVWKQ